MEEITNDGYFNSSPLQVNASFERIIEHIAKWLREGSGWQIKSLLNFYVNIVRYDPLHGGNSYIKFPKELQNSRKGLVNIQNNDKKYFRW